MELRRGAAVLLAAAAMLAPAVGCGDGESDAATTITVLAAASLTDAFEDVADAFEAAHIGSRVVLSFGASSTLREQVLAGAPVDVFASADDRDMDELAAAGALAGPVRPFATNRLAIAVPVGNPAGITGLADFARPDLLLGLCLAEVPCGRLAREALARAGVEPSLDTGADDVRALLTQVDAGELDAAIVYRTDLRSAGGVDGIELPAAANVTSTLPVAAVRDSGAPELAAAFVAFVTSAPGSSVLADHGFGPPP